MAERRMFAKTIIDSDAFIDMPLSTQCLYFHLSMRADDEGFINNPKKIQRMVGCSDDDFKLLIAKSFIIRFETGVVVIKHWKIHNYIRGDRLIPTNYQEERGLLTVKENGAYTLSYDLKEIDKDGDAQNDADLSCDEMRKKAYAESNLPYSFTYKIKRAFEGHKCPMCNSIMSSAYRLRQPTIQHNMPISKGGKHEIDNISVICLTCNTSVRDIETESLNNQEVIEIWDKIIYADRNKLDWFSHLDILNEINMADRCLTSDGQMSEQVRLGKDSLGKDRLGEDRDNNGGKPPKPSKHTYGEYNHVLLTDEERDKLLNEYGDAGFTRMVRNLDEYIQMKGAKYKDHYLTMLNWARRDAEKKSGNQQPTRDSIMNEFMREANYDKK